MRGFNFKTLKLTKYFDHIFYSSGITKERLPVKSTNRNQKRKYQKKQVSPGGSVGVTTKIKSTNF